MRKIIWGLFNVKKIRYPVIDLSKAGLKADFDQDKQENKDSNKHPV